MWPQNFFGHTRFSPVTIELHNYDFRMVYIGLKVRNVLAFDSSQHKSSILHLVCSKALVGFLSVFVVGTAAYLLLLLLLLLLPLLLLLLLLLL